MGKAKGIVISVPTLTGNHPKGKVMVTETDPNPYNVEVGFELEFNFFPPETAIPIEVNDTVEIEITSEITCIVLAVIEP